MTFPRREKVVRRHTRKDPGQNIRRAGLPAFILISLLVVTFSPQSYAAPKQGPASKSVPAPKSAAPQVVETEQADASPVHFNLNFLPWRKESAARQSVESAVAATKPPPPPAPNARGSSYLALGGSIPLRFASPRTWPERMSPADEASLSIALAADPDLAIRRDELLAQHEAGIPVTPTVMAPDGPATTTTASSQDAQVYREPQIIHRPLLYGAGEAILTTELVLGALDNISSDRGSVPGQFRPAVPKERSTDSVPVATAP
jgi:hypothetical protein